MLGISAKNSIHTSVKEKKIKCVYVSTDISTLKNLKDLSLPNSDSNDNLP